MDFKTVREAPWAEAEKLWSIKTDQWRFQRPQTKAGKCRQCGWCYIFCPCGCIVERGTYFAADLDYCKGCGICARECAVDAVIMVKEEVP
ncbi:MAG: hypothetical protein SWO11_15045 [Thermodesulfobacteriota bacterium]|nr:hypothetical protein [Thermodesulfobacteriota bacterium]